MTSEEEFSALKARYEKATTQHERAAIELKIWTAGAANAGAGKLDRDEFLRATLGTKLHETKERIRLLGYGEWVGPLWALVDKDMPLKTAVRIAFSAKTGKRDDEPFDAALNRTLLLVARTKDGKVFFRKSLAPQELSPSRLSASNKREATFRKDIETTCRDYVRKTLVGFEEFEMDEEFRWFERELKVVFEQFYRRLHDRERQNGGFQPSRRLFLEACHVLRLTPPKRVDGAWKRKVAKPRMKIMAREYHPDVTRGATKTQFDAAMKAWGVIERYGEGEGETA